MKILFALSAAAIAVTAQAATTFHTPGARTDSRVADLCGAGHVNEVAAPDDVRANPAGFYVVSLNQQIPLGDPRLVFTNAEAPHLCTRAVATPGMDTANAISSGHRRITSWLFVRFHPMGR